MSKTFKQQLNEINLGRVHQHTQNANIGMITAHRGEYDASENKSRNQELEGHIRKAGFGFVKVKGRYIENHGTDKANPVDEHSYLIIGKKGDDGGKLLSFLKKHGKKYEQDSILHKSHDSTSAQLHGTKEGGYPGMGKTQDVGKFHPSRAGEFHTVLRNRKTFSFESFSLVTPISFSSRQETEILI
jgi:hypothetical protein